MKLIYKLKGFVTLILFFSIVSSCTKDFDELNTNPNLITEKVVKIDGLTLEVE